MARTYAQVMELRAMFESDLFRLKTTKAPRGKNQKVKRDRTIAALEKTIEELKLEEREARSFDPALHHRL